MTVSPIPNVPYSYDITARAFVAPGRTSLPVTAVDSFIPYVTVPTETNSGADESLITGVYTGPTTITTPNTTIRNLIINDRLKIQAANVTIDNCLDQAVGTAADQGMIDCRSTACVNFKATRTTFEPASLNFYTNSIIGHDWTMDHSKVIDTVDGWSPYNDVSAGTIKPANATIQFSYLKYLAWFANDGGIHTDGTHNDAVQLHGGSYFRMHGNAIHGYKDNVLGTPALDSSADNLYPQIGQVFLAQHTVSYIPGYLSSERALTYDEDFFPDVTTWGGAPLIYKNWIWGGGLGVLYVKSGVFFGAQSGQNVDCAAWVLGNTFMDKPRVNTGSTYPYPVRCDTNVWMNGQKWGTTTGQGWIETTTPAFDFGNRYSNDPTNPDLGTIPTAWRGKAVGLRVDSTTASVARA